MKKIYLAIPYSFNPSKSFDIANKIAALLMKEGYLVFSPISHSHVIADHLPANLRIDSEWWMKRDLPMIDWADEVWIVVIDELGFWLIEDSSGVQMEMKHANGLGKPIKYIKYFETEKD